MEQLLRVPLFWKIVVAHVALVVLALALGPWLGFGPGDTSIGIALVLVVGAVDVALVRLALAPVEALTRTARRVREGDWGARTEADPLADAAVERLRVVFNEMLDAVVAARRRQKDVARHVLESEEHERAVLAHELYDGVAQSLAGVLVQLRITGRHPLDPECRAGIETVTREIRTALEHIRSTARNLHPPELEELGVRAAVEAHARHLAESRGVRVTFSGTLPEGCLAPEGRLALFRVLQEALTRAVRGGGARRLAVRFRAVRAGLVTDVAADGSGFGWDGAVRSPPSVGLDGLKERAAYAGGTLRLETAPGRESRLRLVLPWERPPVESEATAPAWDPVVPSGAPT